MKSRHTDDAKHIKQVMHNTSTEVDHLQSQLRRRVYLCSQSVSLIEEGTTLTNLSRNMYLAARLPYQRGRRSMFSVSLSVLLRLASLLDDEDLQSLAVSIEYSDVKENKSYFVGPDTCFSYTSLIQRRMQCIHAYFVRERCLQLSLKLVQLIVMKIAVKKGAQSN